MCFTPGLQSPVGLGNHPVLESSISLTKLQYRHKTSQSGFCGIVCLIYPRRWFDGNLFLHLPPFASNPFYSIVFTPFPSLLPPPLNISSTCGNYYGEFGRGMHVLNLNRCLKVGDSGSPLSCNVVKVSFQIKRGLFDLPNIVFSPFRGRKWFVLSLISLPSQFSLSHTHTYTVQTHTYFIGCFMERSGFNNRLPSLQKYI